MSESTLINILHKLYSGIKIITNGGAVSLQNPLPTDGDSVYVKDVNVDLSDNGDFTGSISDYFDSLTSLNTDSTANNPKSITVLLNRTVYSHSMGFGCNDLGQGFGTDMTIHLLGSGGAVRFSKNFTGFDPNSFLAEFGPKAFNGVTIDFNTAGPVCLSNITIQKSTEGNVNIHGLTPSGDVADVPLSEDGYLAIDDNSSGLAIAAGRVTGTTFDHKFGNAPDFATADGEITIWDGAESGEAWEQFQYQYSTIADIDSISSSDVGDVTSVTVVGLDTNYAIVTQTVTLTGQTRVPIPIPMIRIFRAYNDNSIPFVGHVIVYANTALTLGVPTDTTKIRAIIDPVNQQTEMAVYTVPAGKTGYIRDWFGSIAGANKASNYSVRLMTRIPGKVFRTKHTSAMSDNGTSAYQHMYHEPEVISEKTDIELRCTVLATGVTGASFSAGFDIVLEDIV